MTIYQNQSSRQKYIDVIENNQEYLKTINAPNINEYRTVEDYNSRVKLLSNIHLNIIHPDKNGSSPRTSNITQEFILIRKKFKSEWDVCIEQDLKAAQNRATQRGEAEKQANTVSTDWTDKLLQGEALYTVQKAAGLGGNKNPQATQKLHGFNSALKNLMLGDPVPENFVNSDGKYLDFTEKQIEQLTQFGRALEQLKKRVDHIKIATENDIQSQYLTDFMGTVGKQFSNIRQGRDITATLQTRPIIERYKKEHENLKKETEKKVRMGINVHAALNNSGIEDNKFITKLKLLSLPSPARFFIRILTLLFSNRLLDFFIGKPVMPQQLDLQVSNPSQSRRHVR
ncbi:hypothetical protein [Paraburkholderia hayleyella]|uniref:hypothetical protein n=1 Tax=Paraburkholderia hayleyella TaxID=2152889 RepID=UPI001290DF99|nr:hypothetical protein [Paraburkholderia hayleyella]